MYFIYIFYIYDLYIRFIYITIFRLFMPKSKCSSHENTVNLLRKMGGKYRNGIQNSYSRYTKFRLMNLKS